MQQLEFDQKINLIQNVNKQAGVLREDISSKVELLPANIKSLLQSLSTRDSNFTKYLEHIKSFNFTEELSPVDVFPGVRTALDIEDPEVLNKKADEMKNEAREVTLEAKKVDILKNSALNSYKKLLSTIIEYLKQEDMIYDLQMELLRDLDSPYDIGQLARNT